jgi:hypothetical protein
MAKGGPHELHHRQFVYLDCLNGLENVFVFPNVEIIFTNFVHCRKIAVRNCGGELMI